MGRGSLGLCALVALLAAPTPGVAEDAPVEETPPVAAVSPEEDARARQLFELGDRLYEHGQYDAAIDAFEEAYRLSHRPLMLFNLANAQERAGYLADAATSLEGYVDHAPEDERVAIENRIAALRERIAAGATEPEPPTEPVPLPLPVPLPEFLPVPVPELEPAPASDFVPAAATLAVAGAFLVAGIALGAAALDVRAGVDARCTDAPDGRHLCPADVEPAIADDALFSGLADASFGLAAVGAALGVYFLADALSRGSQPESRPSLAFGGAIAPGSIAASLRARF